MKDSLSLAPTPVGEDCAQLGSADYFERARKECRAFVNQLVREFGEPPMGTRFKIARNPHDFGTYLEVEIEYDPDREDSAEYAYRVEAELPEFWDEEAKLELGPDF